MKKFISIIVLLIFALSLFACGKKDTFEIKITIPANSTTTMCYSDEEISPTGDTITISSGEALTDTMVELKTIEVKEENAYEATYLTPGMSVKIDVKKGAWFKIGVAVENPSDADMQVSVIVEGVEVRIP